MASITATWLSARRRALATVAFVCCLSLGGLTAQAQATQATFLSPEAAAQGLAAAAKAKDRAAVLSILGPTAKRWVLTGDDVADANDVGRFVDAYERKHGMTRATDAKAILLIGADDFPFPIPIVRTGEAWRFDAEQGREEILNRRIGRNELSTIQVLLAIVDAQREYASAERDGSGLLQYAPRLVSTPGKRDGLYWPTKAGESESPLGPLVGRATREGYRVRSDPAKPAPYHGYYFKILTAQGPDAPGGAYNYVARGKMIGGFAVLAYPAAYGNSGVKSFLVNHDGVVVEKDLGPNTTAIAGKITRFNPDKTWKKS